jgi:hypothetical protein
MRAPPLQLGVERSGGSSAPGWAWAQPPGGAGDDTALSAHSVALMVANALRLEVLGLAWGTPTLGLPSCTAWISPRMSA